MNKGPVGTRRGGPQPSPSCRVSRREIGVDEAPALRPPERVHADRPGEHGTVPREGVELAVLTAGVDSRREGFEQRLIELASGERGVEPAGVYAGEARAQPARDHFARELPRRPTP